MPVLETNNQKEQKNYVKVEQQKKSLKFIIFYIPDLSLEQKSKG